MALEEFMPLVDRFISGADYSYETAQRLRDLLAETFYEDPYVQKLVTDLSRYSTGGGPGRLDYPQMRERLTAARAYLAGAI
jgi:hypothetical protein